MVGVDSGKSRGSPACCQGLLAWPEWGLPTGIWPPEAPPRCQARHTAARHKPALTAPSSPPVYPLIYSLIHSFIHSFSPSMWLTVGRCPPHIKRSTDSAPMGDIGPGGELRHSTHHPVSHAGDAAVSDTLSVIRPQEGGLAQGPHSLLQPAELLIFPDSLSLPTWLLHTSFLPAVTLQSILGWAGRCLGSPAHGNFPQCSQFSPWGRCQEEDWRNLPRPEVALGCRMPLLDVLLISQIRSLGRAQVPLRPLKLRVAAGFATPLAAL